jgi:hypothetical protein
VSYAYKQLLGRQRLGGEQFEASLDDKLVRAISTNKLGMVECAYISATQEA